MDSALKQNAIVVESAAGTTPSSPAFKLLRDANITGAPVRNSVRSPERRNDRRAANMVTGLNSYQKTINLPFQRDAATDFLIASLLNSSFSANVIKDASTPSYFTLEERYEAATRPYRRLVGCQANTLNLAWRLGEAGTMSFGIIALAENQATSAIASSTYASPSPGLDPVSTVNIAVSSLFGLSTPRVTAFNLAISNNMSHLYAFGSADPFANGLGLFSVEGSISLYFQTAAEYSTFVTRQLGQTLDLVFGATAGSKDQITMNANVDVFNPDVSDPGPTGQHEVTLPFMGKFGSSDSCVIKWTRNV